MSEFESGPKRTVFGIAVHTTGDGIPAKAHSTGKTHLEVAHSTYAAMGMVGPHYVIDPFGEVAQYAPADVVRFHSGVSADERRSFLDGHWAEDANRIPREVVAWWKARWPTKKSPSHLYPSTSPNKDYVGIELIPAGRYVKDRGWVFEHGSKPGFDAQRFSVEQYYALAGLCNRLAEQYGLDLTKAGVLVGHEDLNPYQRPGWDPGDKLKAFSWSLLNGLLRLVQP
jgi:N-acetyl-anhydromuramyl-L-alanine amidase AmpD